MPGGRGCSAAVCPRGSAGCRLTKGSGPAGWAADLGAGVAPPPGSSWTRINDQTHGSVQLFRSVGSHVRARTLTHTHTLLSQWGVCEGIAASSTACLLSSHQEGSAPCHLSGIPKASPTPRPSDHLSFLGGVVANEVTGHCDLWASSKGTSWATVGRSSAWFAKWADHGQLPSVGPRTPPVLRPLCEA